MAASIANLRRQILLVLNICTGLLQGASYVKQFLVWPSRELVVVRAVGKAKWLIFLLYLCMTRQLKLWYFCGLESSRRIRPCKLQKQKSERSASVERLEHSKISFLYFLDFIFFNMKVVILTNQQNEDDFSLKMILRTVFSLTVHLSSKYQILVTLESLWPPN